MKGQTDFQRHRPKVYPPGFRFMVRGREDWVKKEQDWPANIKPREKQKQEEKEKGEERKEMDPQEEDRRLEKQDGRESMKSTTMRMPGEARIKKTGRSTMVLMERARRSRTVTITALSRTATTSR